MKFVVFNENMKITHERIEEYFPVQRGNVEIDNYIFIQAILYIAENGCTRGPEKHRSRRREF
jgi:hypothetical protein